MQTFTPSSTRGQPGRARGAPRDSEDSPWKAAIKRRKALLRALRSDPDLSSTEYRVYESWLDRVPIMDPNPVVFESVKITAERVGLGTRAVELVIASLKAKGRIGRYRPDEFRALVEAEGAALGIAQPETEGRPRMFTVLFDALPRLPREGARDCAPDRPREGARDCAMKAHMFAPSKAQTAAPSHPIRELPPSERSKLNREEDEKLDPGGGEEARDVAGAMLDSLAADDPLRLAVEGRRAAVAVAVPSDPIPPLTPRVEVWTPKPSTRAPAPGVRSLGDVLVTPIRPGPPSGPPELAAMIRELPGQRQSQVASVARALLRLVRDEGNALTEETYRKYLERVRMGRFPPDLVVGLVADATAPGIDRPSHVLSLSLRQEWDQLNQEPAAG